ENVLERIIIWINQFHYSIQVARVGCHTAQKQNPPAEPVVLGNGLVPSECCFKMVATYSLISCFNEVDLGDGVLQNPRD
nr:hypothetical protein [Tanacetum cinerariifolium]